MSNATTDVERHAPVSVAEETLRYLGYHPDNPATRALVLLAQRYHLDPLLGEVLLIPGKGGAKLYVTRNGLLTIAHRSGHLDGIVVEEERRNSTDNGWTAVVSVWRDDMAHPFRYGAQCKDSEDQARAGNGPEMALARAERRALLRAFNIAADDVVETVEWESERPETVDVTATAAGDESRAAGEVGTEPSPALAATPPTATPMRDDQARQITELLAALDLLGTENRAAMLRTLTEATGRVVDRPSTLTEPEADAVLYYLASLVDDAQRRTEGYEEAF